MTHEKSLSECPESSVFVQDDLAQLNMKSDPDILKRSDSDKFWIGNKVQVEEDGERKRPRTGKEPDGKAFFYQNKKTRTFFRNSHPIFSDVVSFSGDCQAWSVGRNQYTAQPCDTELPVFCQTELKSKKTL